MFSCPEATLEHDIQFGEPNAIELPEFSVTYVPRAILARSEPWVSLVQRVGRGWYVIPLHGCSEISS